MRIRTAVVGAFQENCYLVADEASGAAVLIDPGADPAHLLRLVGESRCTLGAIWLTHAHVDHIGAVAGLKRVWDVPVFLHPLDLPLYRNAERQAALYGLPFEMPELPEMELAEGQELTVGSHRFSVLHTPGHAPGHVIFVGEGVIFGGDLLFAGSIGRTDLPLSSPQAMADSLDRISRMDEGLAVYPGHGPSTSIGRELAQNPFLNGAARVLGG